MVRNSAGRRLYNSDIYKSNGGLSERPRFGLYGANRRPCVPVAMNIAQMRLHWWAFVPFGAPRFRNRGNGFWDAFLGMQMGRSPEWMWPLRSNGAFSVKRLLNVMRLYDRGAKAQRRVMKAWGMAIRSAPNVPKARNHTLLGPRNGTKNKASRQASIWVVWQQNQVR